MAPHRAFEAPRRPTRALVARIDRRHRAVRPRGEEVVVLVLGDARERARRREPRVGVVRSAVRFAAHHAANERFEEPRRVARLHRERLQRVHRLGIGRIGRNGAGIGLDRALGRGERPGEETPELGPALRRRFARPSLGAKLEANRERLVRTHLREQIVERVRAVTVEDAVEVRVERRGEARELVCPASSACVRRCSWISAALASGWSAFACARST